MTLPRGEGVSEIVLFTFGKEQFKGPKRHQDMRVTF